MGYEKIIYNIILSFQCLLGQVGINTTDPQEALHLAGSSGTIRVESLNSINNDHNGGEVINTPTDYIDTYPLYVDQHGDFTLELKTYLNTQATDALDDTLLPTSTVTVTSNTFLGTVNTELKTYTITLSRPAFLEAKYNISHDIYKDNTYAPISDTIARSVTNWIEVSPDPDPNDGESARRYGICARTYTSGSTNSVSGPFYNGHTTYIKFEPTGPTVYTIKLMGETSSWARGGPWSPYESEPTYVEFATDNDLLFFRFH